MGDVSGVVTEVLVMILVPWLFIWAYKYDKRKKASKVK